MYIRIGIVSASRCYGIMGREIESRQGIGWLHLENNND
jgi:hypothetical protein